MNIEQKFSMIIKDLSGICSPTFNGKIADDIISIYELGDNSSLNENSEKSEIIKFFSNEINYNPDGWLIFVCKKYEKEIKELIEREILNSYKNNDLNFDNGEVAETVLYYNIAPGLIIELIDPECFSEVFCQFIEKFKDFKIKNKLEEKELLFFNLAHMSSNLNQLEEVKNGNIFLNLLYDNNILSFRL